MRLLIFIDGGDLFSIDSIEHSRQLSVKQCPNVKISLFAPQNETNRQKEEDNELRAAVLTDLAPMGLAVAVNAREPNMLWRDGGIDRVEINDSWAALAEGAKQAIGGVRM